LNLSPLVSRRSSSRRAAFARLSGLALLLAGLTTAALAAAPLAVSPSTASVPTGGQAAFSASGGAGGYHYDLSTNVSGGHVDAATGAYTAGDTPGTDVITVTDAAGATKTAMVRVQLAKGATPDLGGPRL
jgi:hypothetical protein